MARTSCDISRCPFEEGSWTIAIESQILAIIFSTVTVPTLSESRFKMLSDRGVATPTWEPWRCPTAKISRNPLHGVAHPYSSTSFALAQLMFSLM